MQWIITLTISFKQIKEYLANPEAFASAAAPVPAAAADAPAAKKEAAPAAKEEEEDEDEDMVSVCVTSGESALIYPCRALVSSTKRRSALFDFTLSLSVELLYNSHTCISSRS